MEYMNWGIEEGLLIWKVVVASIRSSSVVVVGFDFGEEWSA